MKSVTVMMLRMLLEGDGDDDGESAEGKRGRARRR